MSSPTSPPRAWHKARKKMFAVWSLTWKDGQLKYLGYEEKDEDGDINKFTGNAYEFILMFPTGLHDKHGKEIYEGDWIRLHPDTGKGQIVEVYWSDGDIFTWMGGNRKKKSGIVLCKSRQKTYEIAGNVHEHPALLEEHDLA